jgi:hypothetical protein
MTAVHKIRDGVQFLWNRSQPSREFGSRVISENAHELTALRIGSENRCFNSCYVPSQSLARSYNVGWNDSRIRATANYDNTVAGWAGKWRTPDSRPMDVTGGKYGRLPAKLEPLQQARGRWMLLV